MRNRAVETIKDKVVEETITKSLNDIDLEIPLSNLWER